MDKIHSWNEKKTIRSEITKEFQGRIEESPEATLTWLEIFVGIATIVKDEQSLEDAHRQFNHMLLGYSEAFKVPDPVFEEMISAMITTGRMEMNESGDIRLSHSGEVLLMQNVLIDRKVFLQTRIKSDRLVVLSNKEDKGGLT